MSGRHLVLSVLQRFGGKSGPLTTTKQPIGELQRQLQLNIALANRFGTEYDCNMPTAEELTTIPVAKVAKLDANTDRLESENNVVLKFAKLTENAHTPTKGSKLAAGYDLYSAYDYVIPPKGKILAKTDLQIALPPGCYGRVAPRSGLAHKHFIDVGAGVIDQDYRGNVGVVMFNFSETEFKVNKHDRIAQLVLERIFHADLQECASLDETDRGSDGFGSTGKN